MNNKQIQGEIKYMFDFKLINKIFEDKIIHSFYYLISFIALIIQSSNLNHYFFYK